MNRLIQRFASVVFVFILAGCSLISSSPQLSEQDQQAPLVLDLFAGRGFAGGAEYERYHLTDKILWRECGTIERKKQEIKSNKKQQASSRSDPNLSATDKGVVTLSDDELATIKFAARELLSQNITNVPPPGALFTMIQPGTYELEFSLGEEKGQLTTALDSVSTKNPTTLVFARDLYVALRAAGEKNSCTDHDFFGIGRH